MQHHGASRPGRQITAILFALALAAAGHADTGSPHGKGFALDCELCHTVNDWRPLLKPLAFDHASTGFALHGAHGDAGCRDCHESLEFALIGTQCGDCHADAHAGSLGFDCQVCHDTTSWENQRAMFDAHASTLFPLLRPHTGLDCEACHGGQRTEQFATTPTDCYSCHLRDFASTTDPNHVAASFSTDCQDCHSPVAARWDEAVFQHPGRFVLDGAHARAGCEACHARGFAGTPTDCGDCHLADYQATVDPAHVAAGFPMECEVCHGTAAWTPALFQHDATGFPLHGGHQSLGCEACHANGYTGTSTECYSCHRADYQATRDPNHVTAGFPTSCEVCHNDSRWQGAVFDHNATSFPLRGSHQPLACEACHANGHDGTPTDCYSCHQADFRATRDPNHVTAGFPTTCEVCHNENRWEGAVFDHNATSFPLRDSHADVDCQACHASGYSGTPRDCYSCHADDYNRTRDPDHLAAGFPTTCESCHRPTRWDDADWDHDAQFFPIYSGEHRRAWDTCADCHVAAGNYRVFECIFCHAHQRGEMDREHREVSRYRYESRACLDCHPDGRADD